MNVSAIDPTLSPTTPQAVSAAGQSAGKTPPASAAAPAAPAAPQASAAALTPAATTSLTGIPASVKPEDRALYTQILRSVGGNVNAALAAYQAVEAAEAAKGKD
jgi:hypothetical protein